MKNSADKRQQCVEHTHGNAKQKIKGIKKPQLNNLMSMKLNFIQKQPQACLERDFFKTNILTYVCKLLYCIQSSQKHIVT